MTLRGFSIIRFVLQHLLGERPIEELDEGPKAERTDQGAKAHKATQQPAQQGAERIGEDAAPEVRAGCVVPQTEGKVIVGRDAEVGGLVERSAQRRDQHRRDDPRQLHRQRRRVAEVGVNGVIERRDDVPDADAVDEGAKADVLAPEPEFQQEKQDVHAQVLGAQRDAEQLRQPHVQGADGVVAEVGLLEKRNAKGDDDDARHHAHRPPGSRFAQCGAVHRGFSFSVFFPYYTPTLDGRQTIYGKIQRYTGDPPYPFNLTSIRSFSSPSPITMSTSCPLGIAFAVRPSAVADIPKWDFGFFTINMIGYQAQGSAVLGMIYLQRKNAAAQEVNVPSCISCYLGVTEPAMFGVNLKFHFPFICGMIGSAIAAVVCVATSTTANAIGVGGIPGILSIQPAYMLSFALCMAIAIVVPFVLTVIVGRKKGVA